MSQAINQVLHEDLPRQTLLVFAVLEVLTLLALSPRSEGSEPVAYAALACLRLCGLMFLGSLLHRHSPKPALLVLTLWGIVLSPPEWWAFASEARPGLPLTVLSTLLAGYGAYAFGKFLPNFAQVYPILGVAALFAGGFQPNLYALPMQLLLGSSMLLLLGQLFLRSSRP